MRLLLLPLFLAAILQQANPNIRPKETSVGKGNTQTEADSKKQELQHDLGITIQECENCTVTEESIGHPDVKKPDGQAKQCDCYDPRKDPLYRAYLGFTIGGVIVALGGIFAIYLQTRATARSAKAAEDSVKLQETALKQWVNLSNFSGEFLTPFNSLYLRYNR